VRVPPSDGGIAYWVVKDPLARECHYLSDDEKSLLEMADGSDDVGSVCRRALTRFPALSSLQTAVSFFVQARRSGLLKCVSEGGIESALRQSPIRSSSWDQLSRCLAIRLPGWNPTPLLDRLEPVLRLFASRRTGYFAFAFVVVAALLLIGRFDRFVLESIAVAQSGSGVWWLAVLLVIAAVKSIHELAHAVTCRMVGAECREIGVTLLFGAPCLYCDVSDLWTIPEKWKRVLVSAAGMLAEILLASLATVVWVTTPDTELHRIALVVMVVCSVSTILVNANPLLRYDGYFMLADTLGIPNFSAVASDRLRSLARRMVWGIREATRITLVGKRLSSGWLIGYAFASGIYRVFVVGCLALAAYRISDGHGLSWLAMPLCCALVAMIATRPWIALLQPPLMLQQDTDQANGPSWHQHGRARWVIAGVTLAIASLLFVPLPRTLRIPVMVVAADSTDVYASHGGTLSQFVRSSPVRSGDRLMRIHNDQLEDRVLEAQRLLSESEVLLDALRLNKSRDASSADRIAVAEKQVRAARLDLDQMKAAEERLRVVAPRTGRFFAASFEPRLENGRRIEAGTLIGRVGHPTRRGGYALAGQNEVGSLRPGQRVRLRHPSIPSKAIVGRVRLVNSTSTHGTPPEMSTLIAANRDAAFYSVQIDWKSDAHFAIPPRSIGLAEIEVDKSNLWSRIRLWYAKEFCGAS
ncbi:MAG: hypothetical protein AAFU85_22285, partial [Planctomycetota bacterium]